jgi:hypothetical protein
MKIHERMAVEFARLKAMHKTRNEIVAELLSTYPEATAEDWERAFDLLEKYMTDFERVRKATLD